MTWRWAAWQAAWSDRYYEWDQLVYDFNFNGPHQRMWLVGRVTGVTWW